jgi:hypothetical protein
MFKTFPIELTSQQATAFLRSQLEGNEGIDIVEHLISIMGVNSPKMLNMAFQSVDPMFRKDAMAKYPVGSSHNLLEYREQKLSTILEISTEITENFIITSTGRYSPADFDRKNTQAAEACAKAIEAEMKPLQD